VTGTHHYRETESFSELAAAPKADEEDSANYSDVVRNFLVMQQRSRMTAIRPDCRLKIK